MERSHQCVSVTWEKAPFDVLWAEARRPGCRVRRKARGRGEGDGGHWEELPSGHVFYSGLRVAVSHVLGDCLGVSSRWFTQQNGTGLGLL